jgi:hypothetical protein
MALGDSTYGRIARHLRDQVDIHRDHGGVEAKASTRPRRLAPGMAGADHDDVILVG